VRLQQRLRAAAAAVGGGDDEGPGLHFSPDCTRGRRPYEEC
jgi:hypothetical protein